jgi:very-short-patch-repair endonuclease
MRRHDPHLPTPSPASQARGSMTPQRAIRWETSRRRGSQAARPLRHSATPAEDVLWAALRGRQLGGLKVRRQHPVGGYVLDFAIPDLHLGIELDGGVHDGQMEDDARRTASLVEVGYRLIRFRNEDVLTNLDGVLARILAQAKRSPLPCFAGEGGWGDEGLSAPTQATQTRFSPSPAPQARGLGGEGK